MNFFKRLFQNDQSETSSVSETSIEVSKELQEQFDKVISSLEKFKKTAYFPKTLPTKPIFSSDSKFGGFPYLRSEDDWPVCSNCNKHMQLFLQLDMATLPERSSEGLVQLFYCTSSEPLCDADLGGWEPFSEASVCRKIEVEGVSVEIAPKMEKTFPEMIIKSWEARDDYPDYEELEELLDDELDDEIWDLMYDREIGIPLAGDKLFGWPNWIQGTEYPNDRNTGNQMKLLFQIDSEVNLPYMFGDVGIGHLTQSPDNDKELAFGWACS